MEIETLLPKLPPIVSESRIPLVPYSDIIRCERESFNPHEWKLEHLLNCGQYGSVHVARRFRLSNTTYYAVKRAHLTEEDNPYRDPDVVMFSLEQMEKHEASEKEHLKNCREALELEIQILYRLRNEENVVRFEGVAFFNDTPHLVMELMDGNLHDFLCEERRRRNRRPSSLVILDVAMQILNGLKGCREAGVLHRDLKPANILVSRWPYLSVKLADFGMGKLAIGLVNPRITWRADIVTLEYRAPELLMGMKYGYGIDIWAWGCIVSEMMTGRITFSDPSGDCKRDTPESVRALIISKIGQPDEKFRSAIQAERPEELRGVSPFGTEIVPSPSPIPTLKKWCEIEEKNGRILELEGILRRGVLVWPNRRWDVFKLQNSIQKIDEAIVLPPPPPHGTQEKENAA